MEQPKNMAMAWALKKRAKKMCHGGGMAEGGEVHEKAEYDPVEHPHVKENEAANMEDADMIARIMHKRKMYSEGGMVANDDEPMADSKPANYDELALEDHLEFHETGANSGDEDGSKLNQEEGDMVSRIMRKRGGRMPRPA